MAKKRNSFNDDLYISNSQIFTYQTCSLKYFYQYVKKIPTETIDVALPFGSAIHSALDLYYRSYKNRSEIPSLDDITNCFIDYLNIDFDSECTTAFSEKMEDSESAIEMGRALLKTFYEDVDLKDFEVVDVEMPLTAPLLENGQPTDFKLVGIIDLLLRDKNNGDLLLVDNKTAARSMAQSNADDNNQMTAYSYLLESNEIIPSKATVQCRFDVFLKLKKPKFQQVFTLRDTSDRRRFGKLANAVLSAIDAKIFIPHTSWMCGGCQYADICEEW
jgi:putative RecB family exonuclease